MKWHPTDDYRSRQSDLKLLDDAYFNAVGEYQCLVDDIQCELHESQKIYSDKRFRFTKPKNPNRTYKVVALDTNDMQPMDVKLVTGIPNEPGHTTEFLGIRGNGSFHTYPLNAISFNIPQNGQTDHLDTQIRKLERKLHSKWTKQINRICELANKRVESIIGREVDYIRRTAGNWAQNMVQSNLGGIRYCPYVHGIHLYVDSDAGYETIDNPTNVKHIWS